MIIYYRICEKEPTISFVERYKNYSKKTILRKCWASLAEQLTENDKVIILHDEVDKQTLSWIESTIKTGLYEFIEVPKHNFEYHQHTVTLIETLAKECTNSPDEYHFLIEDDYLFADNALHIMRGAELFPGFSVPYDYIDRYRNPTMTQVVLGPACHWRKIDSCTMTIGAKGKYWLNNLYELKQAAPTSNDKVFEIIFAHTPCISPLPGVATHLTAHHATPYFNIEERWNELLIN